MANALETVLKRISTMTGAVRGNTLTPDLQRIYNSKMANDQSFTVVMFGMAQMQKLHADTRLLIQMVENHGLTIPDVKKVAESLLNGQEAMLRKRYDLTDSADLVRDAKAALLSVETREDWNLIKELGCDYAQGYYCAKPMPGKDLAEFMQKTPLPV